MDFTKLNEKEIVRRIVIGLNDGLSLEKRKSYVRDQIPLHWLFDNEKGFRNCFREAYASLKWLKEKENRTILEFGDKFYPSFEGLTSHLPYLLFIEGVVPSDNPILGIVGTRRPDYQALHEAFRIGFEASLNGISLISGMAEGVDQASMRGCLSSKAPCLGVLACGHNLEYPALTSRLRTEIIETGGAVISRFAPDTPSYKSNFVSRNMIIAAYSKALVAIQAPRHSGTLITCDYAIAMNKDVYIGSSGVGNSLCQEGTSSLAYEGAPVVRSLQDFDLGGFEPFYQVKVAKSSGFDAARNVIKTYATGSKESLTESLTVRFGDKWYIVEGRAR